MFVNRPNGIDFGDADVSQPAAPDSRAGAPPSSGRPQADFALLDGFNVYPVGPARFSHTNSVSILLVRRG